MSAIIFLIIIGIVVAGGFLVAFIWAVRSGQYDDNYGSSVRMLFENKPMKEEPGEENANGDHDDQSKQTIDQIPQ